MDLFMYAYLLDETQVIYIYSILTINGGKYQKKSKKSAHLKFKIHFQHSELEIKLQLKAGLFLIIQNK